MSYFVSKIGHLDPRCYSPNSYILCDTRGQDVGGPDVGGPDVGGPDVGGPDVGVQCAKITHFFKLLVIIN